MMQNGKRTGSRAILMSVLIAFLALALILGATFALFTARREYEIGVNTGKIDVEGTLTLTEAWSESQDGDRVTVEANGATSVTVDQLGVVTVNGSSITFSNMSLGDGAAFTLDIINASTVNMQYSVAVYASADAGQTLRDNLLVSVGNSDLSLSERAVYLQPWTKVEPDETRLASLDFEISLPWSALEAFEGQDVQSVTLTVVLEAMQANAQTADVVATVGSADEMRNALSALEPGEEAQITLDGDITLAGTQLVIPAGASVTVEDNGATITSNSRTFFNNAAEDGITLDGIGKDSRLIIREVNFVGSGGTGFAAILGPRDIGNAEVVLEGCTFTDMWSAVYVTATDNASVDITITDCTYTNTPNGYSIDRAWLTDPASFTENVTFTGNSGYDKVEEFGLDEIIEDVADVSALENAIAQAADGSDIQIDLTANAGIELGSGMIALPENAGTITINGNGATISADTQYFFNSKPSLNNDGLGKDAVLIIRNVNFVGAGGGYAAVIGPTEVGHTQVTLENCSFMNMYCAVYAGQMEAGAVLDLTIRNCTYTNTQYGYSIYKGYPDYASVTVNVVFEGNTGVTDEDEF